VKLDSDGNELWNKTVVNASGSSSGGSVAVDSNDNVIISGGLFSNSDVLVIKYDSSGNQLWITEVEGDEWDYGGAVVVDSKDNILVTGNTASYGSGEADIWSLIFDSDGNLLWNRTYGGGNDDYARDISLDSHGNMIITGHTESFGN